MAVQDLLSQDEIDALLQGTDLLMRIATPGNTVSPQDIDGYVAHMNELLDPSAPGARVVVVGNGDQTAHANRLRELGVNVVAVRADKPVSAAFACPTYRACTGFCRYERHPNTTRRH